MDLNNGTQESAPRASNYDNQEAVPGTHRGLGATEQGGRPRIIGNSLPRVSLRANVLNTRAQLFEVVFRRVALSYARVFPLTARRVIEFGFLVLAVSVLVVFIHLHTTFVRSPVTCLDHLRSNSDNNYKDASSLNSKDSSGSIGEQSTNLGASALRKDSWPRYGILRVEVIRSPDPSYSLADSYIKQMFGSDSQYRMEDEEIVTTEAETSDSTNSKIHSSSNQQNHLIKYAKDIILNPKCVWKFLLSFPRLLHGYISENLTYFVNILSTHDENNESIEEADNEKLNNVEDNVNKLPVVEEIIKNNDEVSYFNNFTKSAIELFSTIVRNSRDVVNRIFTLPGSVHPEDSYIIEYALEYGFLRLSLPMRQRLNITVKLVVLDPEKNPCFGNIFSRFLMEEFLGYEDLLFGSIKYLSSTENVKGYVGNVMSGQHYRLVVSQMSRSSYLAAALIMLLFTFCVSILLRYSSQQLLIVIADVLQMFETNSPFGIPVAPFMTVILALVAMETIMSEFFGDSITAFYIILIVSVCDHFEAVFCRTEISRKYWPRFFYIYHFAFYAYHYRFNGQFSGVALWVSWLFILHSMIYFFHHYELPNLLSDWEMDELITNNINNLNEQFIGPFQLHVPTRWLSNLQTAPLNNFMNTDNITINNNDDDDLENADDGNGDNSSSVNITSPNDTNTNELIDNIQIIDYDHVENFPNAHGDVENNYDSDQFITNRCPSNSSNESSSSTICSSSSSFDPITNDQSFQIKID